MTQPLSHGRTLLHCLRDGQEHLVRPLVALDLTIDMRDADGNTPLHAAAAGGHAGVLRLLAMNGAATSLVNHAGHSAQHCAQMAPKNTLVRSCISTITNSLLVIVY